MMIHPVRSSGTFIGVIQSYRNIEKIQDRITTFISDHCKMKKERVEELMLHIGQRGKRCWYDPFRGGGSKRRIDR